jgi:DNA-binding transcriptional ArsR family regulator
VAVDIEVTAVGRNGVATLDEASAAARKLREFTRGELAAELGVKPIAVSRWLIQLVERKLVESATDERGLFYRATMEPLESEVFEPKPLKCTRAFLSPNPTKHRKTTTTTSTGPRRARSPPRRSATGP